jgi:hypothetical protein
MLIAAEAAPRWWVGPAILIAGGLLVALAALLIIIR